MWKTSIIFPLLAIILADDVPSSGFKCTEKDFLSTSPLPAELALKVNYQATVRYTNWNDSTTALSKEQNFTDVLIIEHVDRNSDKVFVINKDGVVVRDETSCSKTTKESVLPNFYKFDPLITSKILRNGTNLGEIVDSILTANFTTFGPKDTGIVGGIDAVHWIGCLFNATDDGKTGIQVEVYYAGDKSPLPYSKDYKNPVLLGIHLSTFSANSSAKPVTGNITSHYSLDLTELGKTDENQKNKSIELPRGLYCDGMTMLELPGTIPDRFGATVDYVNTQTKQIDTVQMLYDGVLNITSFSMDFENDKDIPFVSGIDVPKNLSRSTIYRDFGYGIQYILSKDSRVCKSVEPLDSRYGDAKVVNNVVELKTAQDILLNVTGVKFYNAGKKNIEGIDVDSFITKKDENDGSYVVIEVNFVQEDWSVENVKGKQLHSIAHFHKDKTGKTTLETFIHFDNFYNYTSLGPLWIKSNVFPCTTDAVDDNFFYINLKNVSLKDVRDYGADNVECALAEAISEATNISVLRISYFMLKEDVKTHDTLACFLVGEKTTITPTKTACLKPEKEVKEFSKNINETIGKSGFVIKLLTEKQEAKSIGVDKFGVINTSDEPHPDPSPKFVGYSGGSMFILAIFSFIFGGALALGVYLFYNKRRTIGGMAYQVFE